MTMSRRVTERMGAAEGASWQLERLKQAGMLRSNPAKKKKVPSYIKETPRSAGASLTVFPKRKNAWPIGDLFHARLALIYAMSPTHRKVRADVVKAVAAYYPEYKWAEWWNKEIKKPKKDSTLKNWGTYLKEKVARSRRGSFEQRDPMTKYRNPHCNPQKSNPNHALKKVKIPRYSESEYKKYFLKFPGTKCQFKDAARRSWETYQRLGGVRTTSAMQKFLLSYGRYLDTPKQNPKRRRNHVVATRSKSSSTGLSKWNKFVQKEHRKAKREGRKPPSSSKLSAMYCKLQSKPKKRRTASSRKKASRTSRSSKTAYLNTRAKDWNAFQKQMAAKEPHLTSSSMADMWQKVKAHRAKKRRR